MNDVEVRELRYFIAVAEELNFTRAAERLGIAQPPLSAAIAKLERKLGARLLERTSRRVSLTPAGAVLAGQGRIALEALGAAVERTRRQAARPDCLTVAVKAGGGTSLLQKVTQRCAQDPRLPDVCLLFDHPGGPAAAVRAGAADVAIVRTPFDQRGLDFDVLLAEPRVAVLPRGHRLARRRKLCRADLAGEPMPRWKGHADPATVAYWTGTDTRPAPGPVLPRSARNRHAGTGTTQTPEGPEISDMNQLLDVVALGQAVAYVPVSIARRHACAELIFVPVSDLSASEVVAAWPEYSRARTLADFVRTAAQAAAELPEQAVALA